MINKRQEKKAANLCTIKYLHSVKILPKNAVRLSRSKKIDVAMVTALIEEFFFAWNKNINSNGDVINSHCPRNNINQKFSMLTSNLGADKTQLQTYNDRRNCSVQVTQVTRIDVILVVIGQSPHRSVHTALVISRFFLVSFAATAHLLMIITDSPVAWNFAAVSTAFIGPVLEGKSALERQWKLLYHRYKQKKKKNKCQERPQFSSTLLRPSTRILD